MQPKQNPNGIWKYPNLEDVLKAVRLHTIYQFIGVCQETIAKVIVDWPLFRLCRDGGRRSGSTCYTFWGEQPSLEINVSASQLVDDLGGLLV
jgi:hypothetical protein